MRFRRSSGQIPEQRASVKAEFRQLNALRSTDFRRPQKQHLDSGEFDDAPFRARVIDFAVVDCCHRIIQFQSLSVQFCF